MVVGHHFLDWSMGRNDGLLALWSAFHTPPKKAVLPEAREGLAILILVFMSPRHIQLATISAHCWFLLEIVIPSVASHLQEMFFPVVLAWGSSSVLWGFILCCIFCAGPCSHSSALQMRVREGISPRGNLCSCYSCCMYNSTGHQPVKRHIPSFWEAQVGVCASTTWFWLLQGPRNI